MLEKKPISIPDHNEKYRYIPPSLRSKMPGYVHSMGIAPETTVTAKAPAFVSASAQYRYNKAVGESTAVHALRPQTPVFDLLAGRTGAKAVAKGFNLIKKAGKPSWWAENSKKILKAAMALKQANEQRELNK